MRAEDLFGRFPRCVGLYGEVVSSWGEMKRYVELHNGVTDVYVCLYDQSLTIDKIFFDLDSPVLQNALFSLRELVKRLEELNLPYIPLFSGRKGFHVYIPVKPWTPPNIETAKAVLRDVQESLAGNIREADKHVFGDVRRKVRFPNTLNNGNYCVPLPPEGVWWPLSKIIDYAKQPHEVDYNLTPVDLLKLSDVEEVSVPARHDLEPEATYTSLPSFRLVARMIRPCVARVLAVDKEPPHMVRVDLVAELRYLGFTEEQVFEVIKGLGWRDFDEKVTRYQIHQIYSRKYRPPSCHKLKDFVRCSRCGWFYWYGTVNKPW